jgi:serine protease Do
MSIRRASQSHPMSKRIAPSLVLLLVAAAPAQAHAQAPMDNARDLAFEQLRTEADAASSHLMILRQLVRLVQPTVVHIEAKKGSHEKTGQQSYIEEAGAGIVIELSGKTVVMTNRHVIVDSQIDDIHIQLNDGRFFHPIDVRMDRDSDIAVLYVDQSDLIAARLGNSDSVEIGDFVVAIGSPFGLDHSVSYGIVSGKGRRDLDLGANGVRFQDFFQTDAAINPGNSGGPLLNIRGEVIGINTAIASNSGGSDGIGFTIPMNMAEHIARELIEFGYVRRGFLGVSLDSRYSAKTAAENGLNTVFGARVSAITPDSPASSTDLQVGDVILKFNGHVVENDSHLVSQVSMTTIGSNVQMEVFRKGKRATVHAVIRDREEFQVRK